MANRRAPSARCRRQARVWRGWRGRPTRMRRRARHARRDRAALRPGAARRRRQGLRAAGPARRECPRGRGERRDAGQGDGKSPSDRWRSRSCRRSADHLGGAQQQRVGGGDAGDGCPRHRQAARHGHADAHAGEAARRWSAKMRSEDRQPAPRRASRSSASIAASAHRRLRIGRHHRPRRAVRPATAQRAKQVSIVERASPRPNAAGAWRRRSVPCRPWTLLRRRSRIRRRYRARLRDAGQHNRRPVYRNACCYLNGEAARLLSAAPRYRAAPCACASSTRCGRSRRNGRCGTPIPIRSSSRIRARARRIRAARRSISR